MTLTETLTSLAACLCAQITVDGSPEPCWCGVMPGQAALFEPLGDHCEGGMAWVRLANAYPSVAVGQADTSLANCGSGTGIDVEVGIVRVIEIDEDALDEAANLAIVEQQIKDMTTMRKAIQCCGAISPRDVILGSYTPYGPLGAVVGGTWTVYIGIT